MERVPAVRPWKEWVRVMNSLLAGVRLGQAHRRLDPLGPGVAEEGLLQAAGRDHGQVLGEAADDRDVVDVGRRVDQLVELRLGGGDHLRVAMPGVDDGDAGEAIDVLGAVLDPRRSLPRPSPTATGSIAATNEVVT